MYFIPKITNISSKIRSKRHVSSLNRTMTYPKLQGCGMCLTEINVGITPFMCQEYIMYQTKIAAQIVFF